MNPNTQSVTIAVRTEGGLRAERIARRELWLAGLLATSEPAQVAIVSATVGNTFADYDVTFEVWDFSPATVIVNDTPKEAV